MKEKIERILLPILLLSAIVLTVIAFPTIYRAPRDGMVLKKAKEVVVKGFAEGSKAEKLGIKVGDVILSIGGIKIQDYAHYEKVRESFRRGQTTEYKIRRNGEERGIQVTFVGKTARETIFFYLFAVVSFVLAVFIYFRKSRDEVIKVLFLFYIVLGLIFAFFKAPFHGGFFYSILIFSASLISALYVHFTFLLPIKKSFLKKHPKALWLFYIPSIIIFIMWEIAYLMLLQYNDLAHHNYVSTFNKIAQSWIAVSILFGIGNIIHTYGSGPPIVKRQIKWVLWGNVVGFIPYIFLFALPVIIREKELLSFDWATLPNLIVPISFAFAVTKYRLMEVDIVINKSVVYSLATGILIGAYLILVNCLTLLLSKFVKVSNLWVNIISILVIVVLFTPVRSKLQTAVDRLFYKKKQDFRKHLSVFSQTVTQFFDLRGLLSSAVKIVKSVFPIETVAVIIENKKDGLPTVETEGVTANTVDRIRSNYKRPNNQKYVIHKEGEFILSVPLRVKNQVVGTINLGPKLSGDIYTSEDIEFLSTLGNSLVLGVQNISMMEEVSLLSAAIRQSIDGIAIVDLEGNIIFVNDAWQRMHGYENGDPIGKNLNIFHSDEQTAKLNEAIKLAKSKGYWNGEITHTRMNKSPFPTWTNLTLMKDEGGKPIRLVTVIRDITQMKEAQKALRESEEEYRTLTETATDAIISIDDKGLVTTWNKAAERIFGYSKEEAKGKSVADLIIPEEYREDFKKGFEYFRETGQGPYVGRTIELYGLKKNGSTLPLEMALSALKLKEKWEATAIVRDITRRKKAEQELKESSRNLAYLSKKIIKIQEDERKRISRELHDEIGQALTAINFQTESLRNNSLIDSKEVEEILDEIKSIADEASANVHRISYDLRPSMLDELGLIPTLQWYTNNFSKMTNIDVDLKTTAIVEKLSDETKTFLYRIVQEALTNVLKHAEATNANIKLTRCKNCVKLSIEDNGKGFDVKKELLFRKTKGGLGILGMSERAKLAGGNFNIVSNPGHGTKLTLEIPYG
jgi:PAS domain S-box-containing protein